MSEQKIEQTVINSPKSSQKANLTGDDNRKITLKVYFVLVFVFVTVIAIAYFLFFK